jgi:thioredoxin-related protein
MKTFIVALALSALTFGCSSSNKEADTASNQTSGAQSTATSSAISGPAAASTSAATSAAFVSYEAAVDKARTENKYVFVDIYTDWCTWCHRLDKDVYGNPTVQREFAKNFALTKINAESETKHTVTGSQLSERELAEKWNVTGFPTLVFLDKTEKPVFAYIGYLPPEKFLKLLDFVSTGAFQQTEDFDAWLKTHSS